MKRLFPLLIGLLVLPILLFVFNPSWQLGAFGLLLGVIGNFISPLILLYLIYYFVRNEWSK